jgi:two-component system chemotaxis response regulator CheY
MPRKNRTLLLVDDSKAVVARLENIVEEIDGVEVVGTASNGAEAIQLVASLEPDFVLMDIVMPDMDGLAALRVIRSSHPNVHVAMVSSIGGMSSKAEDAFRLGAVQVIAKPFDREVLEALFAREYDSVQS